MSDTPNTKATPSHQQDESVRPSGRKLNRRGFAPKQKTLLFTSSSQAPL
jgi:hypothetical protein